MLGLALASLFSWAMTGRVAAATGYATFAPASASSGQTVTVSVDSYNCPDLGAARLQMLLSIPIWNSPPRISHQVQLTHLRDDSYSFRVPDLEPGQYEVSIRCSADVYLGIVNPQDGPNGFTILPPGAPAPADGAASAWTSSPPAVGSIVSTIVSIGDAIRSFLPLPR